MPLFYPTALIKATLPSWISLQRFSALLPEKKFPNLWIPCHFYLHRDIPDNVVCRRLFSLSWQLHLYFLQVLDCQCEPVFLFETSPTVWFNSFQTWNWDQMKRKKKWISRKFEPTGLSHNLFFLCIRNTNRGNLRNSKRIQILFWSKIQCPVLSTPIKLSGLAEDRWVRSTMFCSVFFQLQVVKTVQTLKMSVAVVFLVVAVLLSFDKEHLHLFIKTDINDFQWANSVLTYTIFHSAWWQNVRDESRSISSLFNQPSEDSLRITRFTCKSWLRLRRHRLTERLIFVQNSSPTPTQDGLLFRRLRFLSFMSKS